YSRPPQGDARPLAVVDAAQRLLSLLRHDPRCPDVQLRLHGDQSLEALADEARLDQILQNLVVNGCRAATQAPGEATVEIRVEADGERLAIEVQDTGPGVGADVRPRLFEPFVTTAPAGEGTGLGLAICRGLVQSMDGELQCLEPGARPPLHDGGLPGAVFRVTLRRPPSGSAAAAPAGPSPAAAEQNARATPAVQAATDEESDHAP
ncbi:MAG: HAMP domain-containing sensor histidine kinase, partial [Nannocystaceae bacterium]